MCLGVGGASTNNACGDCSGKKGNACTNLVLVPAARFGALVALAVAADLLLVARAPAPAVKQECRRGGSKRRRTRGQ